MIEKGAYQPAGAVKAVQLPGNEEPATWMPETDAVAVVTIASDIALLAANRRPDTLASDTTLLELGEEVTADTFVVPVIGHDAQQPTDPSLRPFA